MGSQSSQLMNEQNQHLSGSRGNYIDQDQQSTNSITQTPNKQRESTNVYFKWGGGGSKVYVTGTFSNWTKHYELTKTGNEFSTILKLPQDIYQYKFIVDGEWRFSPQDNTTTDSQGNINNYVDCKVEEAFDGKISSTPSTTNRKSIRQSKQTDQTKATNKTEDNQSINSIKSESSVIEKEINFDDQAPPAPPHYLKNNFLEQKEKFVYYLWQRQDEPLPNIRKHSTTMELEELKDLNDCQSSTSEVLMHIFDSSHALTIPPHVIINHAGSSNDQDQHYSIYTITQRNNNQYTTYKYYTPQLNRRGNDYMCD